MFFLPPVRDDEHAHVDSSSDENYDSLYLDDPDIESVQSDVKSVYADVVAEPKPQQRPKWENNTLQDARDLVGDRANTRRI
jgi:hypothetical protein